MYNRGKELPVYIKRTFMATTREMVQIGWLRAYEVEQVQSALLSCFIPRYGECLIVKKKNFKRNLKRVRDSVGFTSLLREY